MGRSRFTIGPGGMVYVIVAALILIAATYTQANLLYWSFGLMVGGVVVSVGYAILSLGSVEVQRLMPDHAVAGEELVLRYRVHNRNRWLPVFNLVVEETWGRSWFWRRRGGPLKEVPRRLAGAPQGWVMHLGPNQMVQAQARCWPLRRGRLVFEQIILSTAFPFGVIRRSVRFHQEGQLTVYPRLFRVNRAIWHRLALADPAGHLLVDRGGGTEDFYGLRRYLPGDSMKSIDWKHSAKIGQIISREMTQASPPRLMLVLDLAGAKPEALPSPASMPGVDAQIEADWDLNDPVERAISLAASVLCGAHLHGYQIGMIVLGMPVAVFRIHHSLPHRSRMIESLALLGLVDHHDGPGHLAIEPTMVVHPGQTSRPWSVRRCLVLDARFMHEHVRLPERGVEELLGRHAEVRSKRRRLMSTGGWT